MPFDASKVPTGPAGDWFYSGKDGTPLSDEQYDLMKARWVDNGFTPPWEEDNIERGSD